MIISVVNQKGGVGKSTVSTNIAVAFSLLGYKVLFIDADEQRSTLDWVDNRPDAAAQVVCSHLSPQHLRKQARELAKNFDMTIIDAKGDISEASKSAVVLSDFFIIPVGPGTLDLRATEKFMKDVVQQVASFKDVKGAVLLNMMDNASLTKEIEKYVRSWDFPVFDAKLSRLIGYREALSKGLSVSENAPRSDASKQFEIFFKELCEGLGVDHGKKLRRRTEEGKPIGTNSSKRRGTTRDHHAT